MGGQFATGNSDPTHTGAKSVNGRTWCNRSLSMMTPFPVSFCEVTMAVRFQYVWLPLWRRIQLLQQEMRLRMCGFPVKRHGRLLIISGKQPQGQLRRQLRVKSTAPRRRTSSPKAKPDSAGYHSLLPRTYIPL